MNNKLLRYRLTSEEYERICQCLKREPEGVEWALFSALWSEHCSYKSSRVHLKKFSYKSSRVLESFGENAGVVDLGRGERVAFKMESHNHPSFIEPYQGAATGVGGILRDIFTMGARPICVADYLCFGRPEAPRMAHLVREVVAGIGGYGNCVGVANVTGQTEFHESYDGNILVNAFALGLFTAKDPIVNSKARGVGNLIVYVGAKTGRDGVHGASMASESFDGSSETKRPTIQIGDPFYEKLLIESCLEVFREGLVVAIQDMGAAGLTSSSFEMAQKGGVGLKLELDRVPVRDQNLEPEDILLSESQERMLLIAEPKNIERIQSVFAKYSLDAAVIGEVTADLDVELTWYGKRLTKIHPRWLTEEAPVYERPFELPQAINKKIQLRSVPISDGQAALFQMLSSIDGCARHEIFDQYDQRVGARTVRDASSPIGVIKLPSQRLLGVVLGCRPYMMRLDVELGSLDALIFSYLELSCLGFEPVAVTDCLNFGSPENPKVMGDFMQAVACLAKAAEAFATPVISGNVSLYNETLGKAVTPTPAIGMVGLREHAEDLPLSQWTQEHDTIYLVRAVQVWTFGLSSEFFDAPKEWTGQIELALLAEWAKKLQVLALSSELHCARVVGKFGLVYHLARMANADFDLGCRVNTSKLNFKQPAELFQERLYEVIVSGSPQLEAELQKLKVDFCYLGQVVKSEFVVDDLIVTTVKDISHAMDKGFRSHFAKL